MKLLFDMNMSPRWPDFLQRHGFQAAHWADIGYATTSDEEIMGHARQYGWIVITRDLDFGILLATNRYHRPSVIQIRIEDARPFQIGNLLISTLHRLEDELERGALITMSESRTRVRVLPL